MSAALRVYDCPECGAPLPPAADGQNVCCTFCKHATVIEPGSAAVLAEQRSRVEAEALFARLGQPPGWSQRLAAFLVNPILWLLGFPLLFWALFKLSMLPRDAIASAYEHSQHARMSHVLAPQLSWALETGWMVLIVVALLVWSLFGERIDARRDLQTALAAKPPKGKGGHARCRHCDGELEVVAGALGARCGYCGADNLLQIPIGWRQRARKIDAALRLNIKTARSRDDESRRRVRRASMWRVPLVLAVLALFALPLWSRAGQGSFSQMRYSREHRVGVYRLAIHQQGAMPQRQVHSFAACDDVQARARILADARLDAESSQWCERAACETVAMLPLSSHDVLRLHRITPGAATIRVALAPRDYLGGVAVLWDSFGEELRAGPVADGAAGALAAEVPIAVSGWYKVAVKAAPGVAFEPCVETR